MCQILCWIKAAITIHLSAKTKYRVSQMARWLLLLLLQKLKPALTSLLSLPLPRFLHVAPSPLGFFLHQHKREPWIGDQSALVPELCAFVSVYILRDANIYMYLNCLANQNKARSCLRRKTIALDRVEAFICKHNCCVYWTKRKSRHPGNAA